MKFARAGSLSCGFGLNAWHAGLVGEKHQQGRENHKLWLAVKESSTLDLVPTDEIERVENYMQEHGVEPLF